MVLRVVLVQENQRQHYILKIRYKLNGSDKERITFYKPPADAEGSSWSSTRTFELLNTNGLWIQKLFSFTAGHHNELMRINELFYFYFDIR